MKAQKKFLCIFLWTLLSNLAVCKQFRAFAKVLDQAFIWRANNNFLSMCIVVNYGDSNFNTDCIYLEDKSQNEVGYFKTINNKALVEDPGVRTGVTPFFFRSNVLKFNFVGVRKILLAFDTSQTLAQQNWFIPAYKVPNYYGYGELKIKNVVHVPVYIALTDYNLNFWAGSGNAIYLNQEEYDFTRVHLIKNARQQNNSYQLTVEPISPSLKSTPFGAAIKSFSYFANKKLLVSLSFAELPKDLQENSPFEIQLFTYAITPNGLSLQNPKWISITLNDIIVNNNALEINLELALDNPTGKFILVSKSKDYQISQINFKTSVCGPELNLLLSPRLDNNRYQTCTKKIDVDLLKRFSDSDLYNLSNNNAFIDKADRPPNFESLQNPGEEYAISEPQVAAFLQTNFGVITNEACSQGKYTKYNFTTVDPNQAKYFVCVSEATIKEKAKTYNLGSCGPRSTAEFLSWFPESSLYSACFVKQQNHFFTLKEKEKGTYYCTDGSAIYKASISFPLWSL